jgi:pSer/pThr/pTyr-binding forkhead associated (FHA) protein/uncharacterized protein involved in exopolysaccharide biosynthesis
MAASEANPAAPLGTTGKLFVCSGPDTGSTLSIGKDQLTFGRSDDCDVRVKDNRASSTHARIDRLDGRHRLIDLGSTNGTFVNNRRIEEVQLRPGDIIQIGETLFEFSQEAAAQTAEPETIENSRALYFPSQYGAAPADPGPAQSPYGYIPAPAGAPTTSPAIETGEGEGPPIDWGALIKRWVRIGKMYIPYWWVGVLGIIAGAAYGIITFNLEPPPKTARFTIQLLSKANNALGQGGYDQAQVFFQEAEQNFLSRRLVRQTLIDLGNKPEEISPAFVEVIRKVLLEFKPLGQNRTNTYTGSFTSDNEQYTIDFLNTHLANYLDSEIEKALNEELAEEAFFTRESEEARRELEQAEEALLQFKAKNLAVLPAQAKNVYSKLFDLRQRLRDLDSQIEQKRLELGIQRRQLKQVNKYDVGSTSKNNPYAAEVAKSETELASARASGLGPNHPKVKNLEEKLSRLRTLAESRGDSTSAVTSRLNPIYAATEARILQAESQLALAQQEKELVQKQIEESSGTASRLPEQEKKYAELVDRAKSSKKELMLMTEKLKIAKQQVELERATAAAKYDLINPPEIMFVDEKALLQKSATMGAGGGLAVSLLLITLWMLIRTKALTLEMLFTIPRVGRA